MTLPKRFAIGTLERVPGSTIQDKLNVLRTYVVLRERRIVPVVVDR